MRNILEIEPKTYANLDGTNSIKKISYLAFHSFGKKRKYFKLNRTLTDVACSRAYSSSLSRMVRAVLMKIFKVWADSPARSFYLEKTRNSSNYRLRLPFANYWRSYSESINRKITTNTEKLSFLIAFNDKETLQALREIYASFSAAPLFLGRHGEITEQRLFNYTFGVSYNDIFDFESMFSELEAFNKKLLDLADSYDERKEIDKRVREIFKKFETTASSRLNQLNQQY